MTTNIHEGIDEVKQKIQDLQNVVADLQLVCNTTVNVTSTTIFTEGTPESEGGGEGVPPDYPFEDTGLEPGVHNDRKCFVADLIVQETRDWLDDTNALQLDELGNIAFLTLIGIWASAAIAFLAKSTILGLIFGSTSGLLSALVIYARDNIGLLEFSTIRDAIDNNADQLRCDLFNATDVFEARSNFDQTLVNAGIDATNRTFVAIILSDTYLGHLFYTNSENTGLEAEWEIQPAPDCSSCGATCADRTLAGTIVSDNGTTVEIAATQEFLSLGDVAYYANMIFDATEDNQSCGGVRTVDNITIVSGTLSSAFPAAVRLWDYIVGQGAGNLYNSNMIPTSPVTGAKMITLKSNFQFNVQFDRTV